MCGHVYRHVYKYVYIDVRVEVHIDGGTVEYTVGANFVTRAAALVLPEIGATVEILVSTLNPKISHKIARVHIFIC